ncbi:MAG TPA: DUF922 domain-containing protein [Methylomirabilota bacterium]|nr:DUF922 domain-containing protein [Methylomirabilota bacterium]
MRRALAAALVLGLSGCASPPQPPVVVKTNVSTQYYALHGTTSAAIFDEIDRNNLFETSGQRAIGLTTADWKLTSEGLCSAPSLTITLTLVVTLPRHEQSGALPENVRRHWERFVARVAAHEQRHADIFLEGAKAMKTGMETARAKGLSCAELEKLIDGLWKNEQAEIDQAQQRFHLEDSAKSHADRDPLQGQVDGNRTRLAGLEGEMRRSGVTREEHGRLAEDYNRLVAETNDLIEALNWTR